MSGRRFYALRELVAGAAPVSSASAWTFGSAVTLHDALPQDIHVYGLQFQNTDIPALDVNQEILFEITVGGTTKLQIPFNMKADTLVGYDFASGSSIKFFLPEPYVIPAGSAVAVKVTDSIAAALTYNGVKLLYMEPTFDSVRAAIATGLDSAQSEANGWDARVKPNIPVANVVRTDDDTVTITLQAQANYDISAQETITDTVPPSAVVNSAASIVASPTFTVDTAGGVTEADGASAGVASSSVVGAAQFAGVTASNGVGAGSGVGAALWLAVHASAGVGTPTGLAISLFNGVCASAGLGEATGVGAARFAGVYASSGVGAGSATATNTESADGSVSGLAEVLGVSGVQTNTVGSSDGVATPTGVGAAQATTIASSSGIAAATGNAAARGAGVGNGAGVAVVDGIPEEEEGGGVVEAEINAAGVATVSGLMAKILGSVGGSVMGEEGGGGFTLIIND